MVPSGVVGTEFEASSGPSGPGDLQPQKRARKHFAMFGPFGSLRFASLRFGSVRFGIGFGRFLHHMRESGRPCCCAHM
eukprot:15481020-Alexandrium_andersonii.AAC.1